MNSLQPNVVSLISTTLVNTYNANRVCWCFLASSSLQTLKETCRVCATPQEVVYMLFASFLAVVCIFFTWLSDSVDPQWCSFIFTGRILRNAVVSGSLSARTRLEWVWVSYQDTAVSHTHTEHGVSAVSHPACRIH